MVISSTPLVMNTTRQLPRYTRPADRPYTASVPTGTVLFMFTQACSRFSAGSHSDSCRTSGDQIMDWTKPLTHHRAMAATGLCRNGNRRFTRPDRDRPQATMSLGDSRSPM